MNTNISAYEISPYYLAAEAYGYDVKILKFPCSVEVAKERNIHKVPDHVIEHMARDIEKPLPPWWTEKVAGAAAEE